MGGSRREPGRPRRFVPHALKNRIPAFSTGGGLNVRFSNRPFGVKRFQTIRHCSVDVARGLVLLFGIGTRALPSWDSRARRNNLLEACFRKPTE